MKLERKTMPLATYPALLCNLYRRHFKRAGTAAGFKIVSLLFLLALPLTVVQGCSQNATGKPPGEELRTSSPVVVELFTSEGCSSCPPADKLLAELEQTQPVAGVEIIALSEHVDYWNRLGWKDPFSSAEFTRRQIEYATALRLQDYYTPQMIVDGQTEFVGSRSSTALEAITRAARSPKADARATLKTSTAKSVTVAIKIENMPDVANGDTADVMMALTESGLSSKVSRGENSGRELAHSSVTRRLVVIGSVKDRSFADVVEIELNADWNRQKMKAVTFVQERRSRRVLGAAAVKLAGKF